VILALKTGRRPDVATVAFGAGLLGSILYGVARYFDFGPQLACPWREGFGVRCPGCGTTAMLGHMLAGEPGAALAANPLFALIYLTMALFAINGLVGLVSGRSLRLTLSRRQQLVGSVLFLSALGANWIYVLLR